MTIDNLILKIFERRRQIIGRAKQQADSFAHHLASKLLIDGIATPPWLWNPSLNAQSDEDLNVFEKEELLSQLLVPHPQPTVTNQRVVLGGKEDVGTRRYGGTHESNEAYNLEHRPALVSSINDSEIGSALNAPYQDVCATSLQGQIAVTISDVIAESANGEASEGLAFKFNASDRGCNEEDWPTSLPVLNSNDVGCLLASSPELNQSIISPQEQNGTRISSNFTARDQSLSRIQRSKPRQKALELRKTVEKIDKIRQNDTNSSGVCYNEENMFGNASKQCQPYRDDESLGLAAHSGSMSRKSADALTIGECLSKESDANSYCGRITRSRSSRNLFVCESKSKLDNSFDIATVDSGRTIQPGNNCVEEVPKPVHLSNSFSQRVTHSKFGASGKSSLNHLNGHEECSSQNGPTSKFIVSCLDTYDIINQKAKTGCPIETEINLDEPDRVHKACSESNLDVADPSVLEDFDSRLSSRSRMIVKHKTLDSDEMGKTSLIEVIRSGVGKEILEKRRESENPPALLGEVTFSNSSGKNLEKQSLGEKISKQITEPSRDSYETCLEQRVVDDEQVTESRTCKNVKDISDAVEKIHNYQALHGEEMRLSDAGCDIDIGIYQQMEETSYILNQQGRKCELGCNQTVRGDATSFSSLIDQSNAHRVSPLRRPEANDRITSSLGAMRCHVEENQNAMSLKSGADRGLTSSDHELLHIKSSVRKEGFLARDAVDSPCFDGKTFSSDDSRSLEQLSMQVRESGSLVDSTWPQLKRRKIESRKTNYCSADVSFSVKERNNVEGNSNYRNLNSIEPDLESALRFDSSPFYHEESATQSDASKSPDVELRSEILTQETGSLPTMPIQQDELDFGEKSWRNRFPISVQDGESNSFAVSSSSNGEADDSEISFGLNPNVSIQGVEKYELNRCVAEDGFHPFHSVISPQEKDLGTSVSDQITPEFEGVIISKEDGGQRHTVGDVIDHLDLPTTSIERASILEELCKSAVMDTPLFRFSTTHKIHRAPDIHQSAPNGVLENLDSNNALNSIDEVSKQLRDSYNTEHELNIISDGLDPDRIPFSDTYYGQSLRIPPTSPVSKLRISSQSFSSEKKLSSNPELTCFPIEEDPSTSEEQEDKDGVASSTREDICPASMDSGVKRNPLADITKTNVNPPPSVSAAKKSRDRSSLDSVNNEVNFIETHGLVKQKLAKCHSSKRIVRNEAKKKLNLSGIAKESLNNGFSMANVSRKTSLRNGGKIMSGKESKHNNIISNISSFVPLLQQKQAAVVITGKRDVKVKALEAAEAAKRLQEKKENERKLKKETLKLERARMAKENLCQAELKRKKKENELKKKEANVAARKRLREEEEKMEKERKRRRFKGKRQQQKEQEEKRRTWKVEKELPAVAKDAKLNSGSVTANALQKPQKLKVGLDKRDGNNLKKPDTEFVASKFLDNDVRKAAVEGLKTFGHSRVSSEVSNTSREKSYEISPYQSSDDEDDKEDEISPKKFVPTWASKKSLALVVSSQQDVDPDILFAPGSFCSVDEISGLGAYKKQ